MCWKLKFFISEQSGTCSGPDNDKKCINRNVCTGSDYEWKNIYVILELYGSNVHLWRSPHNSNSSLLDTWKKICYIAHISTLLFCNTC